VTAYNNLISRSNAQALIPEVVSNRIQGLVTEQSAALSLFPHIPMGTAQTRMPILTALPTAAFVSPTDTGLKQTSQATWSNKFLNAEEIATIVPVPQAVLDDVEYDMWGALEPLIAEAIGRTLDAAIFFGTNKPSTWGTDIASGAAGVTGGANTVTLGAASQATGGVATDVSNLMSKIEVEGFDPNGLVVDRVTRAKLRNARDTTGQKLLDVGANGESIEGLPIKYAMRGLWPSGTGTVAGFVGDFSQGMLGIRQDITMKLLDQAVITDASGLVVYNLPQQDMVALRVVARYAWEVANTINRSQTTAANRFPFGTLLNP
jgi:HK97 family phage major capsid protein